MLDAIAAAAAVVVLVLLGEFILKTLRTKEK